MDLRVKEPGGRAYYKSINVSRVVGEAFRELCEERGWFMHEAATLAVKEFLKKHSMKASK